MKRLFLGTLALFVHFNGQAQTCTHQTTFNPDGGSVLVYRNGLLLKEGIDYTYTRPVVSLKWWAATDQFSYVYDRMVSIQVPGLTPAVFMNEYRLNREDAICTGDNLPPPGVPVTQLTIGQIAGVIPLVRMVCTGSGVIHNTNPPLSWNCAGQEYYAFTLPDGSIVDYIALPATPEIRASVAMGPPMWTSVPLP